MLTPFQTETEAQLRAALASVGITLEERREEGESETYVVARPNRGGFAVFIYDDEAQAQGPSIDERFETPDYDGPEALRRAFIEAVLRLVRAA